LLTRGSAKNDMQFTGKPNIAGADLYDFNVRYYDPEIGRFYSIDPLWYPAESPYSYCNNNPVNFTDPTGMEKLKGTAIVVTSDDEMVGVIGGYRMEEYVCKPYTRNPNSVMADLLWELEHYYMPSGYDDGGGLGRAKFEWLHILNQMKTQQGKIGGTSNNGGNTAPTGTPRSDLGAVTGGVGNGRSEALNGYFSATRNEMTQISNLYNVLYPNQPIAAMRAKLLYFKARMGQKGRFMDPKNNSNPNNPFYGSPYAANIGNINYGVAARAVGIPSCVAVFCAGWFGGGKKDWTNIEGGGDLKEDTWDVKKGLNASW
jgi:RHS repeat-associated protein